MTTTRMLIGIWVTVASAGTILAQNGDIPYQAADKYPLIPSVYPAGQGPLPAGGQMESAGMPPGRPYAAAGKPSARPFAAANATPLDRVTAPIQPIAGTESDPYGTLTGQPQLPMANGIPPGSYPSPYFTAGPGCCGPLGRNGRIGYELYLNTGPTWAFGEGEFTRRLQTGWMVGGGGRSLFFDPSHTAAWVADIGLSYQYNRGEFDDPLTLFIKQPPLRNPITGQVTAQPDLLTRVAIRALDRTNFNFALGRDWWLWGPGSTGQESGINTRIGGLVGGRWGTAHVDMVPLNDPTGYARRHSVTHGVFVAAHATVEVPMGTTIWFAGLRTEWGYDWTNLVPPIDGNIHNLNLLLTAGIRF